jgi:hypothetical protein
MTKQIIVEDVNQVEEEKGPRTINVWRLVTIGAALVGGGYLMGAIKGVEIGRKLGQLNGYKQAASDIANIIKEERQNTIL